MANICKLDSVDCFERAESVIRKGGILVYPTDTIYGLGVDARNDNAVQKLCQIKGRRGPWSVIVTDLDMLEYYAQIPDEMREFVRSNLPGQVTFILSSIQSDLSGTVLGHNGTIGIRIPKHSFPINLTKRLQFPITTTSVNQTGETPLNNPKKIKEEFQDQVDLIIDAGVFSTSQGSRIYDLSKGQIEIIRDIHES